MTDVIDRLFEAWNISDVRQFLRTLETCSAVDVHQLDIYGRTALWEASSLGCSEGIEILIRCGARVDFQDRGGCSPLHASTFWQKPDAVLTLLRAAAPVNLRNNEGQTALAIAAIHGYAAILRHLLAAGADPNIADQGGCSPLMRAARHRNSMCARLLLQAGASVGTRDNNGATALLRSRHAVMVHLLLAHGADSSTVTADGRTAFDVMARRPRLVEILRRARLAEGGRLVEAQGARALQLLEGFDLSARRTGAV